MDTLNYTFSMFNDFTSDGISEALKKLSPENKKPIIVCIGSDLVLGDSLGPLIGTLLQKKSLNNYIYGTLNSPITAKDVGVAKTYLKQLHPNSVEITVDAAIGDADDVGLIKVVNRGLKPGLGVDKKLGTIGDVSIIGIVAGKSVKNYNLYNLTRLNLVYKMSEIIADGIYKFLSNSNENVKTYVS